MRFYAILYNDTTFQKKSQWFSAAWAWSCCKKNFKNPLTKQLKSGNIKANAEMYILKRKNTKKTPKNYQEVNP